MNKLDYTCSIADPERELNMLFEFWDVAPKYASTTELIDVHEESHKTWYEFYDGTYSNCRPSTRIQEFISVDVLPSGFVWEITHTFYEHSSAETSFDIDTAIDKNKINELVTLGYCIWSIKCIGLASNYAHYADELNMKVIEGVVCDYE